MTDRRLLFLEGCCDLAVGVGVGEGAFGPGPALWVGQRDVAHFDDASTLDVRLTKAVIRSRRDELSSEDRVTLRGAGSDWLEIRIGSDDDLGWARALVLDAVAANLPTAKPGLPPTGPELARRRRFH